MPNLSVTPVEPPGNSDIGATTPDTFPAVAVATNPGFETMTPRQKLKVAFLLSADSESSRLSIETVCSLPNVQPVAALLDTEHVGWGRRFKNLRRNIRKEGWMYVPHRVVAALRNRTDNLVGKAAVSENAVRELLAKAFPNRCFSLEELACKYGFEVKEVGSLNSSEAVTALQTSNVDLGIVLGTRILKESIFSVPKLGCINLHKGKVPEYRGMPPGFWELYDGAAAAGVTIHFVDKELDAGDVVATSEVCIEPTDTPDSLLRKLHEAGAQTLAQALSAIQAGTNSREKQPPSAAKARSMPTVTETKKLRERLPSWAPTSDASVLAKNLYTLVVYYSGLYALVRLWHRRLHSRGCILLYHRVNDYSKDVLTVDTRTFAAQLAAIANHYQAISTTELVNRLRSGESIPPTSVAIHFDDCYRDIYLNGAPILKAVSFPGTAFVSSGFVNTDRNFAHDREKYPFRYPNLRTEDIRAWSSAGLEIGAHTVNHIDLGASCVEEAIFEILGSRSQLEAFLNGHSPSAANSQKITLFSFPFGTIRNIRPEVVEVVRKAGFSALFSAYGGFVGSNTDLYDVPREGCSGSHRPLDVLLDIEGLTPAQIRAKLRSILGREKSAD